MSELSTKRHSLSHIMSQAIAATFPDLTILRGVGPAIDNGFYQDYDFGDFQLTEAHLKDIEKKMKHILKQNQREYGLASSQWPQIMKEDNATAKA